MSTFALGQSGSLSNAPRPAQLIDFSPMVPALQKMAKQNQEQNNEALRAAGAAFTLGKKEGKSEAQILKELTDSNRTPAQVRSYLKKRVEAGTLHEADNPAFLLGLQETQGQLAVDQYATDALNAINAGAYTQEYASTVPGHEREAEESILRQLKEEYGQHLDGMSYYAAIAAEPMLRKVQGQILNRVEELGRERRSEDYRSAAGILYSKKGQEYAEAETSQERTQIMREFGELLTKDQHLIKNHYKFAEDHLLKMAAKVAQEDGYATAVNMLEDMEESVTVGADFKIFRDSDSIRIQNAIDTYEYRAEQEALDAPRKEQQKRSAAQSRISLGIYTALSQSKELGTQEFNEMREGILEAADRGGAEGLATFLGFDEDKVPFTEEDMPYLREFIDKQSESMTRQARIVDQDNLGGVVDRAVDIVLKDGDLYTAEEHIKQAINDGEIQGRDYNTVLDAAKAASSDEVRTSMFTVNNSGAEKEVVDIILRKLYADEYESGTMNGEDPVTDLQKMPIKGRVQAEFLSRVQAHVEETGKPLQLHEIHMMGREITEDLLTKHFEEPKESFNQDLGEIKSVMHSQKMESSSTGFWNGTASLGGIEDRAVAAVIEDVTKGLLRGAVDTPPGPIPKNPIDPLQMGMQEYIKQRKEQDRPIYKKSSKDGSEYDPRAVKRVEATINGIMRPLVEDVLENDDLPDKAKNAIREDTLLKSGLITSEEYMGLSDLASDYLGQMPTEVGELAAYYADKVPGEDDIEARDHVPVLDTEYLDKVLKQQGSFDFIRNNIYAARFADFRGHNYHSQGFGPAKFTDEYTNEIQDRVIGLLILSGIDPTQDNQHKFLRHQTLNF